MRDGEKVETAHRAWQAALRPGVAADGAPAQADPSLVTQPLYTPADVPDRDFDYLRDLGFPGQYPFTRGIHPSMYRGRLFTMRQYAGFGSAEETNRRFRYMLDRGMAGINIAFDLPTQHGYDSDDPRARGEVGLVGVPVNSLRDLETLFDGIPLDRVSPANAINAPAAVILAMYVALAERQGVPLARLGGSTQNDILKEFVARGTYVFPPIPSLRLVTDVIEYCARHLPKWNFINVCGYHVREAGGTLIHEVAFALADAITYVEAAMARGVPVDDFAPRLAFNFTSGTHLFEEAAKFRALRRMWARLMRERFLAVKPESWLLRTGAGSGASQLTAQQPENNIVRITLHSLSAILGGAQSLHTAAYDEALALPTEEAVRIALRTQQVIAHETGVTNTIDPLGGSYFVETLTDEMERSAYEYFARIDELGGMVEAIKQNFPQREIADASFRYQQEVDCKQRIVVGVNDYVHSEDEEVPILRIDPELERKQRGRVEATRVGRDSAEVERSLDALKAAAATDANLMPPILDCARARVSEGEMVVALQQVFGSYTELPVF